MRKLRKAAVVAVMVGSMGMFGAGVAAADSYGSDKGYGHHEAEKGHHESKKGDKGEWKKEEPKDAPGFVVNNPQYMDCSYTDNSAFGLGQLAGVHLDGDATQTMNLGNVCAQTGPVFGESDD